MLQKSATYPTVDSPKVLVVAAAVIPDAASDASSSGRLEFGSIGSVNASNCHDISGRDSPKVLAVATVLFPDAVSYTSVADWLTNQAVSFTKNAPHIVRNGGAINRWGIGAKSTPPHIFLADFFQRSLVGAPWGRKKFLSKNLTVRADFGTLEA